MDDLLNQDALALSAQIAARKLSVVELMTATLDHIDRVNPLVNALVSLRNRDDLLAQARQADEDLRTSGQPRGWLHGIPVAIKDLADAKGLPTSMGSPLHAGQIAQNDELFVGRMKAAGAIVIGKSNTPEFGLGSHTFNPVFGATGNAYDPSLSAGGSSGGAAVALATRMVSVADGSDMMGSLRNPAGWNNVYGMRPSWGRVPARVEGDTFLHPLATNGPMARNPADLAALLDVQAGPVAGRPFNLPHAPVLPRLDTDVSGRRVAWLADWGGAYPTEPGILPTCEMALRSFEDVGFAVDPIAPPFDAAELWQSWLDLRAFANAARLGPYLDAPETREQLKSTAIWEIERGRALTVEAVQNASLIRSKWYAKAAEVFDQYDALILPSAQVWPFDLSVEYPIEINGVEMDTYHRWMEVVVPASLIGLPAICMPAGFGGADPTSDQMPIGLQLIGRHGDDLGLLQIAQALHSLRNWPQNRPPELARPRERNC